MHLVNDEVDEGALLDGDWFGSRGTAADGEDGVVGADAVIQGNDRVETKGFVEDVLDGVAGFQGGECEWCSAIGAEGIDD